LKIKKEFLLYIRKMSDWEDDDWESNAGTTQVTTNFDSEDGDQFSDEEDETLLELAKEKEEALEKEKANKPKKTFDEIMAERKLRDAQKQLDAQKKEEEERTLTPEEQLQKMRDGIQAAELEDNRLMNELLGVETEDDSKSMKEKEDPEALEKLTMSISNLVLNKSSDYSALSQLLISKLRSSGGSQRGDGTTSQVSGFLETLLSEIVTVQIADQLNDIGDVISAAKSTAEALEKSKPKVTVVETKKEDDIKKLGKKGDDKLYGMFESVADGNAKDESEEDSEEESDEEEVYFM
jgi:hypothetical protein